MNTSSETSKTLAHAAHKLGSLSPQEHGALWDMEEHFWTSGADNARATTATNAVMVFPYPRVRFPNKGRGGQGAKSGQA